MFIDTETLVNLILFLLSHRFFPAVIISDTINRSNDTDNDNGDDDDSDSNSSNHKQKRLLLHRLRQHTHMHTCGFESRLRRDFFGVES